MKWFKSKYPFFGLLKMAKKLLLIAFTIMIFAAIPSVNALITPPVEEIIDSGTMGTWSFGSGSYQKYGTDHFDPSTWTYSGRPVQVIKYTMPVDGFLDVSDSLDGDSLSPRVDLWLDGQQFSAGEFSVYYRGRLSAGQTIEFHIHPMYNAYESEVIYDDKGNPPLIFEGVYDAQSGSVIYSLNADSDSGGNPVNDYVTCEYNWYPVNPTTSDVLEVSGTTDSTGTITSYMWFIDSELATELNTDSWTWTNPPAGEHVVTFMVRDSNGNSDEYTDYILVTDASPEITPRITFTPENPTTETPINFVDASIVDNALGFSQYWYLDGYLVEYATGETAWTWEEPEEGEHNIQLELYDGENSYYTDLDFTVASSSQISVDIVTSSNTAYVGTQFEIEANIDVSGTKLSEIFWYIDDVPHTDKYNLGYWIWNPSATGVYTIAVSVLGEDGRYASDSVQITVEDKPLVNLLITDKKGVPIPEVGISLTTINQLVDDTWTDVDGEVVFQKSPPINDGVDYYIQVQFLDKPGTFWMFDEQSSTTELAYLSVGPFQFKTVEDYNMTIKLVNGQDSRSSREVESHREDLVEMYLRFYQAARFFDTEYSYTYNTKPIPIYTHVTSKSGVFFWSQSIHPVGNPPTTDYPCISVELTSSGVMQSDAPMNREWHEFSHYFMWDQYGALPPNHYNLVNNRAVWIDNNHAGIQNHCTADSFKEAFAEFTPLFMQLEYGTRTSWLAYIGVGVHYAYPIGKTHVLYELNYPKTKFEELAISSLLYDLWDGVDARDYDYIQLGYDDIIEILMWKHDLDTFYRLNQTTGVVDYVEDEGVTSTRHISYLSDLYDTLHEEAETYELNPDDIDELFAYHGFFVDADNSGGYSAGDYFSAASATDSQRRNYVLGPDKTMTIKSSGSGELLVEVSFPEAFSDYDYSYTVPLESGEEGVEILAPPEYYNATVYLTVYENNEPSKDSYSFTSTDYWDKVETGNGIGSYSFQSSGSGFNIVSMGMIAGKIIAAILIVLMALGFLRQNGIL